MNKSNGFTLIEMVVVIVIVSILAAFAVPTYLEIRSDARVSSIQTALGAVRAASAMAHALYLAPGTSPATVTMDNVSVALTNGYPSYASILTAAGINTGTTAGSYTTTGMASPQLVTIVGATTPGSCLVSYTAAGVSTPPVITSTTGGC